MDLGRDRAVEPERPPSEVEEEEAYDDESFASDTFEAYSEEVDEDTAEEIETEDDA